MTNMLLKLSTRKSFLSWIFHKSSRVSYYHSKAGVYGYNPKQRHSANQVSDADIDNRIQHSNIYRLVEAYRSYGHKKATLDPLGLQPEVSPQELSPEHYGIVSGSQVVDLQGIFHGGAGIQQMNVSQLISYLEKEYCNTIAAEFQHLPVVDLQGIFHGGAGIQQMNVSQLISYLEKEYCNTIAAEFQHLPTEEEREWFAQAFETKNSIEIPADRKVSIANLLLKCQAFDHFLASKFVTLKRYGGEGGESMMVVFDEIFRKSATAGIEEIVICMPHRGRLNFLTSMLKFRPVRIFQKVSGISEIPPGSKGTGDVVSHLYTSVDLDYEDKQIHVSLIPNPSHLEANNPVAVGKLRSKQQTLQEGDYSINEDSDPGDRTLCVQVHGDASFSAQGIVAETFSFAECPHYRVGGSVHFIVNNQIGFTTEAERGRSSQYSSDLGKINGYPVLHVNADFPEDVLKAASIAMEYRQKFRRDVIIDFICFRKYGHNELDDPSFTQPLMYNIIRNRKSIPEMYAEILKVDGICTEEDLSTQVQAWNKELADNFAMVQSSPITPYDLKRQWSGYRQAPGEITSWDTGVSTDLLQYIGTKSVEAPEDFKLHPTISKTHCERRVQKMTDGSPFDWATAEALAFGSLMMQGFNIRISGQDVGRGTFSHRHAMLVDQDSDHIHIPLNHMADTQGFLEVANSSLSEEAVLGFEYGMSIDNPKSLVIWEAQFGDFFNGAQPIIDTYVTSGENKWLLQSGLVMLLPHGLDGAGPEHSSCRMERFLQGCDSSETQVDGDDVNIQILNPTTPAQYFHLLRRQMVRDFRKPAVVVAPKILLRLPAAMSTLSDLGPGMTFNPVLGDPSVTSDKVERVVFCTQKHYYAMMVRDYRKPAVVVAPKILLRLPAAMSTLSDLDPGMTFNPVLGDPNVTSDKVERMVRDYRKPAVVVAPKILIRLPAAMSTLSDLDPGMTFNPVLGDPSVTSDKVERVVFCTGKHYYAMVKERETRDVDNMAIVRLESLCPFPTKELQAEMNKYPKAKEYIWVQEEHRNMGAWSFVSPRFENLVGCKLRYIGRDVLGLPAVGIGSIHQAEANKLMSDLFS